MKKVKFLLFLCSVGIFLSSCVNNNGHLKKPSDYFYTRRTVNFNYLGKAFITKLDENVFSSVMDGKIKAYKYDSLTPGLVFKVAELRDRIDKKETFTITPKPDNPDYTVDTTVITPFKPANIVGHSIGERWILSSKNNKFNGELYAIGFNWKPVFANVELHEQPAFWISFHDLEKILDASELKMLNQALYDEMTKRLSDY